MAQQASGRCTLDESDMEPAGVWSVDTATLERVVERLQAGLPIDTAFDVLDAVLGEQSRLDEHEIDGLAQKLRGLIPQLADLAAEPGCDETSEDVTAAVARARALGKEKPPPEFVLARGHLRLLALVVQDVLEFLAEDTEL
ncbi:DUF6415 family natural product biosynthesis protein [Streptomyces sp. NPDC002133]|uniref:DUF6415 family natural product biosynthesis protein n=1 Tax=Streptomyces sp. NPDC002133 TaxID=3154409 RepID=UPI00332EC88F